jgi:hypothetical protein
LEVDVDILPAWFSELGVLSEEQNVDEVDVEDDGAQVFEADVFLVPGVDSEDLEHDELDFMVREVEHVEEDGLDFVGLELKVFVFVVL